MINGKRVAVVLPAYNAEKTLEATVHELPDLVDIRILVDDHSSDRTVEIAHQLNLQLFVHDQNYGYGRNQQTCYREALAAGADVVIRRADGGCTCASLSSPHRPCWSTCQRSSTTSTRCPRRCPARDFART